MLPLNIVMPATKREAASVFLGAMALERRRTPECTSFAKELSAWAQYGEAGWRVQPGQRERYLIMSCGVPVCDSSWVCNLLLQAVGTECTKSDRRGPIDAAEGPEGKRHCVDVNDEQLRLWLRSEVPHRSEYCRPSRR